MTEEKENFDKLLKQKVEDATKELTQKNKALEESLRKERDIMDILGHELRTPLGTARNAILMLQDKFNKGGIPANDKTYEREFQIAIDNIKREVKLLETILSSTRIDNNRININLEKVKISEVVADTMLSFSQRANLAGLELKTDIPSNDIYCSADRDSIQQVLDNLTDNAIKYTKKGTVTIKAAEEGDNVVLYVSDTGEGIPEHEIPNLGKKFYRVEPYLESSKDDVNKIIRPGGTGIGLYVVFGLIKAMNGKLEIKSEFGKGSTFIVSFDKFKS